MLRKKALSLLVVIAVALVGCSPASIATPAPAATATVPLTPAPQLFPQIHMDALDRSVTISAKPVRIVSLAPSVTEMLFAIGAGPQMMGSIHRMALELEACGTPLCILSF
jgi:cobalamin transport system substrate-binding protein